MSLPETNYASATMAHLVDHETVEPTVQIDNRQRPSDHGRVLGGELARLADRMAELHPEVSERCRTCAFRLGTYPNSLAGTLAEALHCVAGTDPAPFGCHQTLSAQGQPEQLCAGYVLARLGTWGELKEALARTLEALEPDTRAKPGARP